MDENGWILSAKKKDKDGFLSISPSTLGEFIDCDRCGWLKGHRMGVPRHKFPTLPGGVDIALHQMSDLHRLSGKLPELWAPLLPGRRLYPEPPRKLSWRWAAQQVLINGIPDEWILEQNGRLSVVDFKTRGFPAKLEIYPSYRLQADTYALLAEKTVEYPRLSGRGYLICFVPELKRLELAWRVELVELAVNPGAALKAVKRAAEIIRGPAPAPSPNCAMCAWAQELPR